MDQISSDLHGVGIKLNNANPIFFWNKYADHARILNKIRSVSGIFHTLLGVAVFWKVQIQSAISFDSTDGDIRCI